MAFDDTFDRREGNDVGGLICVSLLSDGIRRLTQERPRLAPRPSFTIPEVRSGETSPVNLRDGKTVPVRALTLTEIQQRHEQPVPELPARKTGRRGTPTLGHVGWREWHAGKGPRPVANFLIPLALGGMTALGSPRRSAQYSPSRTLAASYAHVVTIHDPELAREADHFRRSYFRYSSRKIGPRFYFQRQSDADTLRHRFGGNRRTSQPDETTARVSNTSAFRTSPCIRGIGLSGR
jgi:hypothetical protein